MSEVGMILVGLSGIANFAGNVMKGDSEKDAADYNAALDAQAARDTEAQYVENERVFRQNTRQELGAMSANYAASGISVGEGSAAEVLRMSAANAELDALKLRHEGFLKAKSYRESAILQRKLGKVAQTTGYLSATASLLGSAGTAIGQYGGRKATTPSFGSK